MLTAKKSKVLVVILTVAAVSLTLTTLAVINVNTNLPSSGSILTTPNIGVYSDSGCTTNMTSINWGSLSAGSTTTTTAYIKNTGTATETLSLGTSNWAPTGCNTYFTLSWNQVGTQLTPGQVVQATLTLIVSPSITGVTSFSNTIIITASA